MKTYSQIAKHHNAPFSEMVLINIITKYDVQKVVDIFMQIEGRLASTKS